MLYYILYPFRDYFFGFNVFRYITFRAAAAVLTAMVICFILGPRLINKLKEMQVGQFVREEGPDTHKGKTGTPTMGGLLILFAVVISTILWADILNPFVLLALYITVVFGAIGFTDDYLKVIKKHNLGLTARWKFSLQIVFSAVAAFILLYMAKAGTFSTRMGVPFFKEVNPELGWFFVLMVLLVLVGASNAVNLTDGLDGLAVGSVMIAAATYTILVYIAGHAIVAGYLNVINIKGAGEVTVFTASIVGASLGFLWFNAHPAQIFMGDTGSLALGGAIGITAVIIRQEILLILVGGLFVIEALSVILQVASYRIRGKRIFKMAPIHHHFELKGWHESKIIIRFWIVAIIFALMSLSTLKLR